MSGVTYTRAMIESLPNYKKRTATEYSAVCPNCGGDASRDSDRFRFWPNDGNYWCRKCGIKGFVDSPTTMTPEERAVIMAKIEAEKMKARQAKRNALAVLNEKRPDMFYHRYLNDEWRAYLTRRWGVTNETIDEFGLGYCMACPTSPYSDSVTIPYYWKDKLINLRHRLMKPNGQGKYRPEMAGLPSAIFNARDLGFPTLLLVEGEFKTMVLSQQGFGVVGVSGKNNFNNKWVELFKKVKSLYITLDPGAERESYSIAKMFNGQCINIYIVSLPVKPDDFFVLHNGDLAGFEKYLGQARKV